MTIGDKVVVRQQGDFKGYVGRIIALDGSMYKVKFLSAVPVKGKGEGSFPLESGFFQECDLELYVSEGQRIVQARQNASQ